MVVVRKPPTRLPPPSFHLRLTIWSSRTINLNRAISRIASTYTRRGSLKILCRGSWRRESHWNSDPWLNRISLLLIEVRFKSRELRTCSQSSMSACSHTRANSSASSTALTISWSITITTTWNSSLRTEKNCPKFNAWKSYWLAKYKCPRFRASRRFSWRSMGCASCH